MAQTFKRGVHSHDHKALTADKVLEEMPTPDVLYFPLIQHIGAPAQAVVAKGDKVKVGSLIAKAGGFVSSNIFSSVSGEVKGLVQRANPQGNKIPHLEIINDHLYEEVKLKPLSLESSSKEIIDRVQEAGIVGMGGATFPTHVKLSPNMPVDLLVINAVECEPYITCDYRLMLENAEEIILGVRILMRALNAERAIIGIELNKPEAIKKLTIMAADEGIEVVGLKTKYPQGAEKQLIYAVSKRKVPAGGLPMAVGAVVCNLQSALAIKRAVIDGIPSYNRTMTVSGNAADKTGNFWVRTGITYQDVYDYTNGENGTQPYKVLSGGPMMGFAQANLIPSVTKGTSALLFLSKDEDNTETPQQCINCGACRHVCPMNLMPMYIDLYTLHNEFKKTIDYHVMDCIECGSCSYVCPARRPLLQSIRLAKKEVKKRGLL